MNYHELFKPVAHLISASPKDAPPQPSAATGGRVEVRQLAGSVLRTPSRECQWLGVGSSIKKPTSYLHLSPSTSYLGNPRSLSDRNPFNDELTCYNVAKQPVQIARKKLSNVPEHLQFIQPWYPFVKFRLRYDDTTNI